MALKTEKETPRGSWTPIDDATPEARDGRDVLVAWRQPQGRQLVAHYGTTSLGATGWIAMTGEIVTPTHYQELGPPPEAEPEPAPAPVAAKRKEDA